MKLKQYLSEKGLTQREFGEAVGVPQATINRYVNGERFPDRDMILKIIEATGGHVSVVDWYEVAAEPSTAESPHDSPQRSEARTPHRASATTGGAA